MHWRNIISKIQFALDYDGTFTADPDFWLDFIDSVRRRGHNIRIVTLRTKAHDFDMIHKYLEENYQVPIVWCDGRSKREVTEELGIKIDIWIDDTPEAIGKGGPFTPDQLERETRPR